MERAFRISRAQAVAIPPAVSPHRADLWFAAVGLTLLALALLLP